MQDFSGWVIREGVQQPFCVDINSPVQSSVQ
jgi:hypothetical protein